MKKLLPILCTTVIVSLSGCANPSIDESNTNTALDTTMSVSNSVISSSDIEIDLTSSSTMSIEESIEEKGSPVMEFFVGHTEKYSLTLPADINWQIPSPDAGYTYAFDADNEYKGSISVKTSYSIDFDSDINDIIAFTGNVDVDTVVVNKSTNVTIAGINMTKVNMSYSYDNKAYNQTFAKTECGYYFVVNNNYVFISCFVVNDNATQDELNKMTGILEKTVVTLARI